MMKNYQAVLKYGVIAIVFNFGLFVSASEASGVFTEVIDGGNLSSAPLSAGQQFVRFAGEGFCNSGSALICTEFGKEGIEGETAQNLSPQMGIQAETIAITSPYEYIRGVNNHMQRLIASGPSDNLRSVLLSNQYL